MRAALLVVGLLLAPPSVATAQDTPIVDLSGGYSFLWDDDGHALNGWYATVALNTNRWFALAADASGHFRSQQIPPIPEARFHWWVRSTHDVVAFMGGPRVTFRRTPRLAAFAQPDASGQVTAESEFMGDQKPLGRRGWRSRRAAAVDIWLARRRRDPCGRRLPVTSSTRTTMAAASGSTPVSWSVSAGGETPYRLSATMAVISAMADRASAPPAIHSARRSRASATRAVSSSAVIVRSSCSASSLVCVGIAGHRRAQFGDLRIGGSRRERRRRRRQNRAEVRQHRSQHRNQKRHAESLVSCGVTPGQTRRSCTRSTRWSAPFCRIRCARIRVGRMFSRRLTPLMRAQMSRGDRPRLVFADVGVAVEVRQRILEHRVAQPQEALDVPRLDVALARRRRRSSSRRSRTRTAGSRCSWPAAPAARSGPRRSRRRGGAPSAPRPGRCRSAGASRPARAPRDSRP